MRLRELLAKIQGNPWTKIKGTILPSTKVVDIANASMYIIRDGKERSV